MKVRTIACLTIAAPAVLIGVFALCLQISVWTEALFAAIGAKPLAAEMLSSLSGFLSGCALIYGGVATFVWGER